MSQDGTGTATGHVMDWMVLVQLAHLMALVLVALDQFLEWNPPIPLVLQTGIGQEISPEMMSMNLNPLVLLMGLVFQVELIIHRRNSSILIFLAWIGQEASPQMLPSVKAQSLPLVDLKIRKVLALSQDKEAWVSMTHLVGIGAEMSKEITCQNLFLMLPMMGLV